MNFINVIKKVFICFLLTHIQVAAFSQSYFLEENVNWLKDEAKYEKAYMHGEIGKIKDDLMIYLEASESLEKNFKNFHFFDYNFDGYIDIIYSGDAGTESKRTLIFEPNENGYSKTFDKYGALISLYPLTRIGQPLSLVLKEQICCGGFSIVYEIYQPIFDNGKLELKPSTKYSFIVGTELPDSFYDAPILFEVQNEKYLLRLNPMIDNQIENEELHIVGNVIAEYTVGSKGYAIAENQENSDRIWWFVIMINNNPPSKSIFDTGSNNKNHYYSIGWMSNRYLKQIK